MTPATKRCSRCREVKSLDDFHSQKSSRDGRQAYCKPCCSERAKEYRARPGKREEIYAQRREHYRQNRERLLADQRRRALENPERVAAIQRRSIIKRKYGLTDEDYNRMVAEQMGRCAICLGKPDGKPLHIDHDHDSGRVRGLLCTNCNTALGLFKDEVFSLYSAIRYLTQTPAAPTPVAGLSREIA